MAIQVTTKPLRLLVVDDRRDSTLMLKALLVQAGHEVMTAENGASALAIARQFSPDAILSDLALPGGLDGYAFARAVQNESSIPQPRFIAITGHDDAEHRQLAQEAGFQHYFVKPPPLDKLLSILDQMSSQVR